MNDWLINSLQQDELSVDLGELGQTLDATQRTFVEIVRQLDSLHDLSSLKIRKLKDELDYSLVNRLDQIRWDQV